MSVESILAGRVRRTSQEMGVPEESVLVQRLKAALKMLRSHFIASPVSVACHLARQPESRALTVSMTYRYGC